MATSSILGGEHLPAPIAGRGTDALGPSDNSDSGSDAMGAYGDGELGSDSDAAGTGERASVEGMDRSDTDILPDHVIREGEEGTRPDIDDTGAVPEDGENLDEIDDVGDVEGVDDVDAADGEGLEVETDVDDLALDDDIEDADDPSAS
jgi:hypothetical protein